MKPSVSKFLQEYPLYKPFKVVENYKRSSKGYTQPNYFAGETFTYFCESEQENKTFEIEIPISIQDYWGNNIEVRIPNELFNSEKHLDYIHHFEGVCKSCKKYRVHFLLHIYSDNKIPDIEGGIYSLPAMQSTPVKDEFEEILANIYIEKVGLSPKQNLVLEKSVVKHFDRETNNWYYNAIKSLNQNLGIAAFAYFRRIIEKELQTIVKEISDLNSSDTALKTMYEEFIKTGQVYSIYENIYIHLPKSLQALGINPIKTLYQQTSEGLHSLSEEECLERSESINLILNFVIKKINEEKSEILIVREAAKKLR